MELNYRSITQMNMLIRENLYIIPEEVDVIVGIPRSGMLPATLIALLLNKPLFSMNDLISDSDKDEEYSFSTRVKLAKYDNPTALIVDDSCFTGRSILKAKERLKEKTDINPLYACIYVTSESKNCVDLWFEICEQPRMFEWNIMNHGLLSGACLDLDGVLCYDPTEEENDDGEKYIEFIKNAKPLFVPQHKIGAIVTSRLEKYRDITEGWLRSQGITYDYLIMMDLPDMETRRRLGNHGAFKASVYGNSEAILFIESNPYQAEEIYKFTNKNVYCVGNNTYYEANPVRDIVQRLETLESKMKGEIEECLSLLEESTECLLNGKVGNDDEFFRILEMYPQLIEFVMNKINHYFQTVSPDERLMAYYLECVDKACKGKEEFLGWLRDHNKESLRLLSYDVIDSSLKQLLDDV